VAELNVCAQRLRGDLATALGLPEKRQQQQQRRLAGETTVQRL
jgi:hypothetical protein